MTAARPRTAAAKLREVADFVYTRDASWWSKPSTSGTRPPKLHLASSSEPWSACSSRIMLITDMPISVDRVDDARLCKRCLAVADAVLGAEVAV